ncbi:MAG: TetR/AcrR family transcriptional regulator [Sporichthyaceae bacterium]
MTGPSRHGPVRTRRQLELIDAAARLFARDGYHAVGINDISAEVGLSGPALYRHYPSKEALLIAVFDDAITAHLEETVEVARKLHDPLEALPAIVDLHVDFVFARTAHIVTWRMEYRSLPDADRHRLRYLQRLYTEEWVSPVSRLRPELKVDHVRTMCQGAIALIQSATEFSNRLPREVVGPTLAAMALHSLIGTPATALPSVGPGFDAGGTSSP